MDLITASMTKSVRLTNIAQVESVSKRVLNAVKPLATWIKFVPMDSV